MKIHMIGVARLAAPVAMLALAGCVGPFGSDDYMALEPQPEEFYDIDSIRLEDESRTDPVVVEEGGELDALRAILDRPEPPATIELTLEEVRAAAMENNLDLKVQLISPSIAQTAVDAEEAKFESTFVGSLRHTTTDSPTFLATEGSQGDFTSNDLGVNVPLRTGGTTSVNLLSSRTATNNPFSLLDPAYNAVLRFSISQPLLRGAGTRVNTHSIRVAKYQQQITTARTKLETIRILAAADRAYWLLYAAQRELEVSQQQFELAMAQLERARRRVQAGDAAEIEILRAETGVAERLELIIVADTTIRRRARDLKRIMNRPDLDMNSATALVLTTEPHPVGLDLDPYALADYAIANRMEMLEMEIQLALDASTIDFRRNQKLPLFLVDYSYNINGLGDSVRSAWDQVGNYRFDDWSLGVRAEIPLGNEAAKAGLHQAILQRFQDLATREQRRQAIRQEVFDTLDQLQQNWERIIAARQETILAGRTFEGEQRQFDVGARTSTDVLDAATRLALAQSREIQALTDYQIAEVDIAFATGTLLGYQRVQWEPIDVDDEG